jgi:hypothetical protein
MSRTPFRLAENCYGPMAFIGQAAAQHPARKLLMICSLSELVACFPSGVSE